MRNFEFFSFCNGLKRNVRIILLRLGLASDLVNDRDVDNLSSGGDKVVNSRSTKNEKIATLMSELEV